MNLGDMLRRTQARFGSRSLNAQATRRHTDALNDAYETVHGMRNWPWLWKTGTVTVDGTAWSWDLPSDCRGVAACGLASIGRPLPALEIEQYEIESRIIQFLALYSRGTPECWCARGGKLYLMPPPAGADTAHIGYYRSFSPMVLPTDVPDFDADYHSLIVDLATAELAASESYDPGIARSAQRRAERKMKNLMFTGADMQAMIRHLHFFEGQF